MGSNQLDELMTQAQKTVDQGLEAAREFTRSTATATKQTVSTAQSAVNASLEQSEVWTSQLQAYAQHGEERAVYYAKSAIKTAADYPYAVYGGGALVGILAFPFTRRFLWRQTVGRLRTPETVLQSAEARLQTVKLKVEDYGKEMEKLQTRMQLAEEELKRGMTKLKATRYELQRLASQVQSTETAAANVVSDLSSTRHLSNALQLRSEAANNLATLRANRATLQKLVYRIARREL